MKGIHRFLAVLSEKTELPLAELCRECSTEIAGRREITVSGVKSIQKYEEDGVIMEVCDGCIYVKGESLVLKNFYHTTLCIKGKIDSIEFLGDICR